MKGVIFRHKELIDREKEVEFFKEWFEKTPDEILWVYGPKSTGKTTLIEYIVENELFNDFKLFKSEKYNVKYINFRQKLFGSYDSFLNSMMTTEEVMNENKLNVSLNLGVFKIDTNLYRHIKNKEYDFFDELFKQYQNSTKKSVLIIDEIQALEDIYIDTERELLREFLNFCVRLTKETHLAHVVILSSNTIFINQIYNNAKLKVTSRFKKIAHLDYETTKEWLEDKKFKEEEIELIWEYLGGCIPLIQRMMRDKHEYPTLEDFLKYQQKFAKSEIMMLYLEKRDRRYIDVFEDIAKKIIKDGFYKIEKDDFDKMDVISYYAEKEILFFEPLDNILYPNNQLYLKGMEAILDS